MNSLPVLIARLAAAILPSSTEDWGQAMIAEAQTIARSDAALGFALGCLGAAFSYRLSSLLARQEPQMTFSPTVYPRRFAILCGAAAIGLGFSFMAAGGAPASYFMMNGAAFILGLLALGVIAEARRIIYVPAGLISISLAGILLAVSLWGVSADGMSRWMSVGGVMLQPSLILVPAVLLGFARSRDSLPFLAIMIAALALALQPDRAMAAALAAGLIPVAATRRGRLELAAIAVALSGFAFTMIQPDMSPAVPFVDQILFTSFTVHPLAGLAVWCGAALMLLPAIAGIAGDSHHRLAYAAFGAIWLTVIIAAALGNYPTPLVGYGGSAILGYTLSLIGLPSQTNAEETDSPGKPDTFGSDARGIFRAGLA